MADKTPQQLLQERTQRILDAYELRQPDRVPITLNLGYLLARLGGITNMELERNPDLQQELLEKWAPYFDADTISGGSNRSPLPSITVGDRQASFPGWGQPENGIYQFVEGVHMQPEEYDEFIFDPSDFAFRKLLPRIFGEMASLSRLPRLVGFARGSTGLAGFGALNHPEVVAALDTLRQAIQEAQDFGRRMGASARRMEALGFPSSVNSGASVLAPFDVISDHLRGMRGSMLDMYRCPEKVLAAEEKILPMQLELAIENAKASGRKYVFIPLHRGSDGFMSIEQFECFYWPQLKALMLGIIDAGYVPNVFYEGYWDQRLKYLQELPKGKTIGAFERSDMAKVKEAVGDIMCIMGGFPVSLLTTNAEQVRAHTRWMCEVVGRGGGFIMRGSAAIDHADPELVKVWVDATREYGQY